MDRLSVSDYRHPYVRGTPVESQVHSQSLQRNEKDRYSYQEVIGSLFLPTIIIGPARWYDIVLTLTSKQVVKTVKKF